MPIPRKGQTRSGGDFAVANDDAARLADEIVPMIERAVGVQWYETFVNDADLATLALCRLRRSRAGLGGGPEQGDAAVRQALQEVDPGAVAWIASRAISYMDENGYPEALAPYVDEP